MKTLSMHHVKKGVVIFLAVLVIVFFLNVTKATAGNYLGEVCWSAYNTEDENGPINEGPFLIRSGITYMGDSYFLLQGTVKIPDGEIEILNGTAVIVENEVYVNMNGSLSAGLGKGGTSLNIQSRLNALNLNGTFWAILNYFDTSDHKFGSKYRAGTMTFTTCP